MDSATRRTLWVILFNLFVMLWCFSVGVYLFTIEAFATGVLNVALAVLNFTVAVINYRLMQRRRELNGLEPFSIKRIKVPMWMYGLMQKYLFK